jgi:glycerol-3-phosphate dehydrogenase
VLELCLERPDWCVRVSEGSPVVAGQLAWAARREMVVTLGDAVMRRTPLGAMEFPGAAAIERAAMVVGSEQGWSEDRTKAEIAALCRGYETDQGTGTLNASKT